MHLHHLRRGAVLTAVIAIGFSAKAGAAVSVVGFSATPNPVAEGSSTSLGITVNSSRILDGFNGGVTWGDDTSSGAGGLNFAAIGHTYADEGSYVVSFSGTGFEHDFDGLFGARRNFSNAIGISTMIPVFNVAPTITSAPAEHSVLDYSVSPLFNFAASATDPGIHDILTYRWDLDNDGIYEFIGSSGQYDFTGSSAGALVTMRLRVEDGDGGFDTHEFDVTVSNVPEPSSAGIALLGAAAALRWRRARKACSADDRHGARK